MVGSAADACAMPAMMRASAIVVDFRVVDVVMASPLVWGLKFESAANLVEMRFGVDPMNMADVPKATPRRQKRH
jgi:hypothetical protein